MDDFETSEFAIESCHHLEQEGGGADPYAKEIRERFEKQRQALTQEEAGPN